MVRTSLWARAMIVLLWPLTNDQALVLGAQDGLGSPCGVGGLAQKAANDGIAVPGLTALTLACGLVVAGAQGAPRRQARRGAEAKGIVADRDQNHGGADRVDARNGLEQTPSPGVGLHRRKEITVQLSQLSFETAQVIVGDVENKAMAGRQVSVHGRFQDVGCGPDLAAAERREFGRIGAGDQALDHFGGAHAVDVGDHPAELDPCIVQELVQAVLFPGQRPGQLASIA